MTAKIIDGKSFAAGLRSRLAVEIRNLRINHNLVPGLAVILVGDNAASHVYVKNKEIAARESGINSSTVRLADKVTMREMKKEISRLNKDPAVHGILVQLPLPAHLDEHAILNEINPDKDVDGFHVVNAGLLATGGDGMVPCTPLGCLLLLKEAISDLSGLHAVVIGRSNIVGKPMAALLLRENCTVTIVHSKTRDLPAVVRQADIVVAAVGKPKMVKRDWIKPGAVVLDVGINRVEKDGKHVLVGDVDFDEVREVASYITPVPGGIGPMTIACLLQNTYKAACRLGKVAVAGAEARGK